VLGGGWPSSRHLQLARTSSSSATDAKTQLFNSDLFESHRNSFASQGCSCWGCPPQIFILSKFLCALAVDPIASALCILWRKTKIDFSRHFPTILYTSAMPLNKTTPVATQTSFSQVNRRHSSFTLASLTPSLQQPNESDRHAAPRVARTSSSSHLAHSGTVYAAATQVRHGTERVYAESQVWAIGGSTSFLCDGSHTVFTVQN
jgi:hypothetical protein